MSQSPYQSPQAEQTQFEESGGTSREKLRKVAGAQRRVLFALLTMVLSNVAIIMTNSQPDAGGVSIVRLILTLVGLAAVIFAMIAIFQLSYHLGNVVMGVIAALLMFVPCISLLMLFFVNQRATKFLESHGVKVGFMGVHPNTIR